MPCLGQLRTTSVTDAMHLSHNRATVHPLISAGISERFYVRGDSTLTYYFELGEMEAMWAAAVRSDTRDGSGVMIQL